ncbi:MAG: hypothetical protein KDD58_11845 [Bdellovibrionales bacterium]|nr:hypothetical protein [Bdellovibrionales bacterium]
MKVIGSQIPAPILSLLQPYKVIAVGEHHGTNEIPELVANMALALAKTDQVVLALEIEQANQKGLNKYMETGDESLLEYLSHFAREYQDGRSSIAMVELLKKVRLEKNISILAFDPDFSLDSQNRETKMAEKLLAEIQKKPNHRFLILSGNIHSSTKIGNFFDPNYRPMAFELFSMQNSPLEESELISIITRYDSATIWACINDNAEDCGEMKLKIEPSNYSTSVDFEKYFLKEPQMSEEGYNATFFIREVNPSKPYSN